MNNTNVKWEQRQEPPSFRQWLESYHLMLIVMLAVLNVGAIIKHFSAV